MDKQRNIICPICNITMEKGMLLKGYWTSSKNKLATMGPNNWFGSKKTIAYHCTQCGKIEIYSEMN